MISETPQPRETANPTSEQSPQEKTYFQSNPTLTFIAQALLIMAVAFFLFRQFAALFQQLLLAIFILYLVAPVHHWLERRRISRYISYVLIFTVSLLLFTWIGFLTTTSLGELELQPARYQSQFHKLIDDTAAVVPIIDAQKIKTSVNDMQIVEQGRDWLRLSFGSLFTVGGHVAMIAIFLVFLIIEQGSLTNRLKKGFGEEEAKKYLQAIGRINTAITKYVAVKTFCSILIGVITTIILLAFGAPGAYLWGFLAFLLNYIPYIGPIIAATVPGVFAIAALHDPWLGVLVLILLHVAQGLVGNILDPLMLGQSLNVSPTMTLVFMVLWGAIWGIPGMILSVPLLVTTQIILENFEATKPLATLLKSSA